jgi:hypothetical protein
MPRPPPSVHPNEQEIVFVNIKFIRRADSRKSKLIESIIVNSRRFPSARSLWVCVWWVSPCCGSYSAIF